MSSTDWARPQFVYVVEVHGAVDGLHVFATEDLSRKFVNALPDGTDFDDYEEPLNGEAETAALIQPQQDGENS